MKPIELMIAQRKMRQTCEEFAETLGVLPQSISEYRRGFNPIPRRVADRITELMAMPEDEREKHIFRNRVRHRRFG